MINVNNNESMMKKVGKKGWQYGKAYMKDLFLKYSPLSMLLPIMIGIMGALVIVTYYQPVGRAFVAACVSPFPALFWSGFVVLLSYVASTIWRHQLWKLLLLRTITFYDKYLFILFAVCAINSLAYLFVWSNLAKVYLCFAALALCGIGVKVHTHRVGKDAMTAKKSNIITLTDLYYNRLPQGGLLLLDEAAVVCQADDLLDVVPFAQGIHDMLLKISARTTHVIGLTGRWGSGKTSIMNFVQAEMASVDDIVIATFSPWKYDDTYSLFKGFSEFVFAQFGDAFGYMRYKSYLRKYQHMLFGYIKSKRGLNLDALFGDESTDIAQMREIISDKIKSEDKKMIIVIDDIDRLHKPEILFIFKVIQTVFNFDHLIYVLNFDEARINKIFKEEFATDVNYLDKIIQTKINVPQIDVQLMQQIGKTSIRNMIAYYDVRIVDTKRLDQMLDVVTQQFHDLRDLTRFLNSIATSTKQMMALRLGLDMSDLIGLEYVKYSDLSLYYELSNNACLFISEDVRRSAICHTNIAVKQPLEAQDGVPRSQTFASLFEKKEHLLDVLALVFPYVSAYKYDAKEEKCRDVNVAGEIRQSFLLQRCYTGSFFDVYFTGRDNTFTKLNKVVEHFIDDMNFINVESSNHVELEAFMNQVEKRYQALLLQVLEARLHEIVDLDKLFGLIINSEQLYEKYEVSALLLAAIIKKETGNPQKYMTALAEIDLRMLERVLRELQVEGKSERLAYGQEMLNMKLSQRESEAYDPFHKEEYKRGIGRLYSSPHYRGDKTKSARRLTSLVNQENIFRVIADYINRCEDEKERANTYYYDVEAMKIISAETIDKTLKHGFYELNDDQSKIKLIYEAQGAHVSVIEDIDFTNL